MEAWSTHVLCIARQEDIGAVQAVGLRLICMFNSNEICLERLMGDYISLGGSKAATRLPALERAAQAVAALPEQ